MHIRFHNKVLTEASCISIWQLGKQKAGNKIADIGVGIIMIVCNTYGGTHTYMSPKRFDLVIYGNNGYQSMTSFHTKNLRQ